MSMYKLSLGSLTAHAVTLITDGAMPEIAGRKLMHESSITEAL